MWPTPTTRDWRSGKASEATHARNARPLAEQVAAAERRLMSEEEYARAAMMLNPTWVEWLMGWPIGWTDPDGGPSSEDFRAWLESNRTALNDFVDAATVRWPSAPPQPGASSAGQSAQELSDG